MNELEQISQLIAEYVAKTGPRRIITQEIFEERCRHYLEVAKRELEACGPEESNDNSKFCPVATIFGPRGEETPHGVPIGFRGGGEKQHMMHALSATCKTILAQAVILRMVGTGSNLETIAKAMHLNMPDPHDRQKMDYFEERMWNWIEKNYGKKRLAVLPPEFRRDVLMVGGTGPSLQEYGLTSEYSWQNGKLVFHDLEEGKFEMTMFPRWWQ